MDGRIPKLAGRAVLLLSALLAVVEVGRVGLDGSLADTAVAIAAVVLFMPLHLWHLSYGVRGERPPHSGPTLTLSDELPETKVLILTGLGHPGHLSRALEARVGGFMRKNAPSDELADALRRVAKGQRFLDPALVETALNAGANPLTDREADVLRAAADGASTADIGRTLFLSPATVRNYLSNAITKLDARNRIDAIRIARQAGWI